MERRACPQSESEHNEWCGWSEVDFLAKCQLWPPPVFRVNVKHGHCKSMITFIVISVCKRRKKYLHFVAFRSPHPSIYFFIVVIELYFRYILPQWHRFLSARDNQTEQAAAHIREWRYHLLNEVRRLLSITYKGSNKILR